VSNVWGTPKQILEKYEERRAIIGDFQATLTFIFSGTPFEGGEEEHDDVRS
jgi:hypothetical protein